MQIEVEYCVQCGLLDKAIEVERALLSQFGDSLEAVRLKTGAGGVFKVRVDEDEILDGKRDSYDLDAIRSEVRDRLVA